jgi:hypothetical protein
MCGRRAFGSCVIAFLGPSALSVSHWAAERGPQQGDRRLPQRSRATAYAILRTVADTARKRGRAVFATILDALAPATPRTLQPA